MPITTLGQFAPLRAELKSAGRRVVFTNGVFDIIHRGHVEYLRQARALGECLVLGINSDESVRRLKGDKRPFIPLEDRMEVVAEFRSVDFVISFDEDTPIVLIESIVPDVLVKGGDWPIEKIVGHEVVQRTGGKVFSLPYLEGRSTTGIAENILSKK
jgi:D-beta-D-heptose 7-phosphate kinase/D-beta-D-heptose 1-phosphate adenosyltransferase